MGEHLVDPGAGKRLRGMDPPDAPRPCGHLVDRLLATHEQDLEAPGFQPGRSLQAERGLAGSRLTGDQDDGAADQPAAQHPVEFGEAGWEPVVRRCFDAGEGHGRRCHGQPSAAGPGRPDGRGLLDERVPSPALGAAAAPLRGPVAALGAGQGSSGDTHRPNSTQPRRQPDGNFGHSQKFLGAELGGVKFFARQVAISATQ